jgi:hypothetical protein
VGVPSSATVQGRPRSAAGAMRKVQDLRVRFLVAVITAINGATRTIEMGEGGGQTTALRGGRHHQTGACRDTMSMERIHGPSHRLIMKVVGDDAGRQEPRGQCILENVRDQGEWLVDTPKPVEHQRFHCCPRRNDPHRRMLLGRLVHDTGTAEFVKHRRHASQMRHALAPVGWSQGGLLSGGDSPEFPT